MMSFYRYFNIFSYKILKNYATCLIFRMPLEKHVNYKPKLKNSHASKICPGSALASKFCSEIFKNKIIIHNNIKTNLKQGFHPQNPIAETNGIPSLSFLSKKKSHEFMMA